MQMIYFIGSNTKKECYDTLAKFHRAIRDFLRDINYRHQNEQDSLLTLNFQISIREMHILMPFKEIDDNGEYRSKEYVGKFLWNRRESI